MEQYLDAKVKKKRLFSHIPKTKTILGLLIQKNIWNYHKQVILVDFNPAHHSPITFV